MIDIHGKKLPEIEIHAGNGITAFYDFQFFYEEIPPGVWGWRVSWPGAESIELVGPGHGARDNYGNGALSVDRDRFLRLAGQGAETICHE